MKTLLNALIAALLAINAIPAGAQTTSDAKADGKAFGAAVIGSAKDAATTAPDAERVRHFLP